jgi:hypothetical protein
VEFSLLIRSSSSRARPHSFRRRIRTHFDLSPGIKSSQWHAVQPAATATARTSPYVHPEIHETAKERQTDVVSVPQEQVQPWCTRCQDPHFRPRSQARERRRLPSMHPLGLQRVRAAVLRGSRGCPYLRQQVHGQDCRKGVFPSPCPRPPLPRRPHQQDVVVRWS